MRSEKKRSTSVEDDQRVSTVIMLGLGQDLLVTVRVPQLLWNVAILVNMVNYQLVATWALLEDQDSNSPTNSLRLIFPLSNLNPTSRLHNTPLPITNNIVNLNLNLQRPLKTDTMTDLRTNHSHNTTRNLRILAILLGRHLSLVIEEHLCHNLVARPQGHSLIWLQNSAANHTASHPIFAQTLLLRFPLCK